MTTLPQTTTHLLAELEAADQRRRHARITIDARKQREKEEELLAFDIECGRLAALAAEGGASQQRIAAALHTKATKTAVENIKFGRQFLDHVAQPVTAEVLEDRFRWADPILTVTLTAADLEPIFPFMVHEPDAVRSYASLRTLALTREGEGWTVADATHPVAVLFFSPKYGELRAEAEVFIA